MVQCPNVHMYRFNVNVFILTFIFLNLIYSFALLSFTSFACGLCQNKACTTYQKKVEQAEKPNEEPKEIELCLFLCFVFRITCISMETVAITTQQANIHVPLHRFVASFINVLRSSWNGVSLYKCECACAFDVFYCVIVTQPKIKMKNEKRKIKNPSVLLLVICHFFLVNKLIKASNNIIITYNIRLRTC